MLVHSNQVQSLYSVHYYKLNISIESKAGWYNIRGNENRQCRKMIHLPFVAYLQRAQYNIQGMIILLIHFNSYST